MAGPMLPFVLASEASNRRRISLAGPRLVLARRLLREARATSRLNHPNIVALYEIAGADGRDFIVMEYVDGEVLSHLIPPGGLPIPRVLDLAGQITGGLAAAHRAGLVHRDLKPSNVIVTPDGRAKVLDFGLAKIAALVTESVHTTGLTVTGLMLGTVGYMSPELIEEGQSDARSDVFSLGVLFFEMLTGHRPFEGDSKWGADGRHGSRRCAVRLLPQARGACRLGTHRYALPRRAARRPVPSAVELAADLAR